MEMDPVVRPTRAAGLADPLCPTLEALAAWIDQGLGAADRAWIDTHFMGCRDCRLLVAQVIEIQVEAGAEAAQAAELRAWLAGRMRVTLSALGWGIAALAAAAVVVVAVLVLPLWWTEP
jgi:hypothetical protein